MRRTTCLVTASEVEVESRPTPSVMSGLAEAWSSDPHPGVNKAVSRAVPAGKELWHMMVMLGLVDFRLWLAQALIALLPSKNVSHPDGLPELELTVATRVTV